MILSQKIAGILAVLVLTGALIALRFPDFLASKKGMVVEPYGDGFKAYMSPIYHAGYDSTFSHFGGMHYPYGDHLVMSDPQPILANSLKLFFEPGDQLVRIGITWTHYLMLLSIMGSALFLFLLLRELELPIGYSVWIAAGLSFMAPMVARMAYHFGLAQPAAVPVVLYLLLRFHRNRRWLTSVAIGFSVLLFSLFHLHYFGLLALTISLFFLLEFLREISWRNLALLAGHYGVQVGAPLLLLFTWLYGGQPVDDRSSQPWGFLNYRAKLDGVFASMDQPHFRFADHWLTPFRSLDGEAMNYIGLVAAGGFFLLLWRIIRTRGTTPLLPDTVPYRVFLTHLFWAGTILLIFSLGFPFVIPGMERLLKYLGPLQQFRALGRFSWLFFYTSNIVAFAWAWHTWNKKKWGMPVLALVLGLEAFFFIQHRDLRLDLVPGLKEDMPLTQKAFLNPADYQASLTIPFFHLGSENFWWEPEGFIQQEAMVLAMRTGIPMMNAMMSRTSLRQTYNLLQLVSEPYRRPAVLEDLPSQKPLLLLRDEERFVGQAPRWEHFADTSSGMEWVYAKERLKVFALPLSFFEKSLERRRKSVLDEMNAGHLAEQNGYLVSDSLAPFVRVGWDETGSENGYHGKGGFTGIMKNANTVFEGPLASATDGQPMVFSIWMFLREDLRPRTDLILEELDPGNRGSIQRMAVQVHTWATVFDPNGWALIEIPFTQTKANSIIRATFQNKSMGNAPLFLDELLIRPERTHVYRRQNGFFWKDNRFYPEP
ncbi:MAG: hypothetical protein IPN74_11645 [Haliscomenobacter sp.]|nr:hypothetical protein [Haliscomenobacter sp.]